MLKFLLGSAAILQVLLLTQPVKADLTFGGVLFTNGTVDQLTVTTQVPPGNQPLQHPCIICGTNQPQQDTGGTGPFPYNNYAQGGNQSAFAASSTATFAANGHGDVLANDTLGTGYLASFLRAFVLSQLGVTLNIGVDVNTALGAGPEVLERFAIVDIVNHTILADTGPITFALFPQNNGTGFADYFITGFDLDRGDIQADTQLVFLSRWSNASDGAESFFLVPQVNAVPGPLAGAGIPGLLAAFGVGGLGWYRRRRKVA